MATTTGTRRRAPHDDDAEASVLGAAMLSSDALDALATVTVPADFYRPAHAHIASTLVAAWRDGWTPDPITVGNALERAGLLDDIGGRGALIALQADAPGTRNAPHWARIVAEHAMSRSLIGVGSRIVDLGYESGPDGLEQARTALGAFSTPAVGATLEMADIAAILDGRLTIEAPTILRRTDGQALLYPGRMNVIQAEPAAGKSWLALKATAEVLDAGGAVLYLDYEDLPAGIVRRLQELGVADDDLRGDRFRYLNPPRIGANETAELHRHLDTINPDLVVIDGVAESLARQNLSEDHAEDVVAWVEALPRPIARTGAAVLLLDHVVKDREQRGRWARGSGHKLAAVDGAAYGVEVRTPFSRNHAGVLRLLVAKDRHGLIGGQQAVAAVCRVTPTDAGARVAITLEANDTGTDGGDGPWRPTTLMARVADELAGSPTPLTARGVTRLVRSNQPGAVLSAVKRLIEEGFVTTRRRGNSVELALVRTFGDPGPVEPPDYDDDGDPLDYDG